LELRIKSTHQENHIRVCLAGFFEYTGDARIRMYTKWLTERGDFVDLVCSHKFSNDPVVFQDGARIYNILKKANKESRSRYIFDYAISFLKLVFYVTKLHFQEKYHIIHFHNIPDFIVFAGLLPKLFGVKLILDIHDPMPEVYISKFEAGKSNLLMKLLILEEKISCFFSDAVITANGHFRDNLVKRDIPKEKITVINNCPDPAVFTRKSDNKNKSTSPDKFTLIFPGTIAPRYGLDVAIKALPYLIPVIPNVRLRIIGPLGEYSNSLLNLARTLQVNDYVEFISSVPNTDIPQFLEAADVGIYPAIPGPHMSIAVPGKILEFAIMGLPIVSTRLQIVEEIFDNDSILYIEDGNYKQFASHIMKIYKDPSFRRELEEKVTNIVEDKFSYVKEAQNYYCLLNKLVMDQ
jgi:glycosyltransferase involved in cell wall biosynthesis